MTGTAIVTLMLVDVYWLDTDPLFAKGNWREAAAVAAAGFKPVIDLAFKIGKA
jgi:hypothetical protein